MNILDIEEKRIEINRYVNSPNPSYYKLSYLVNYFELLSNSNDKNILFSFGNEFINIFLKLLYDYNAYGIEPLFSERLLKILELIDSSGFFINRKNEFIEIEKKMRFDINDINNILKGKNEFLIQKPSFPVLEKINDENFTRGYTETITVSIQKSDTLDFIVLPHLFDTDKELLNQVKISWRLAVNYCSKYIKHVSAGHKVIVQFNNNHIDYSGNSFGTTLTLSFITELLDFYNSFLEVKSLPGIAYTGGIEEKGEIGAADKTIITEKIRTAFFSPVDKIVLKNKSVLYAESALLLLKDKYPERNLSVIGCNNLYDLLNRRDLVYINKKHIPSRFYRSIKRNSIYYSVALLLTAVLIFMAMFITWDTNPASLDNVDDDLYVKNKYGKILWSKKVGYNVSFYSDNSQQLLNKKIIDINGDNVNEVIISEENLANPIDKGSITCYNHRGRIIWRYKFLDKINTYKDNFLNIYTSHLIDVDTTGGKKILYCIAINEPLYACAIFKLDLRTGKRLKGTLWHAGHIYGKGMIGDFNKDGKKELVITGINNSYECAVVFSINIENLNGQGIAEKPYTYINIPRASFNKYILFPKTIVNRNLRYNKPWPASGVFSYNTNVFRFIINALDVSPQYINILYFFNNNFSQVIVEPTDNYQVKRDSLIAEEKLDLPYTNTKEFKQMIKNKIRYWDGENFVSMKEYFKNKK